MKGEWIKCVSVRLKSLTDISEKACKAEAFDGSSAVIPKSCVFDWDHDVAKSEAVWIAEWVLKGKSLQYSNRKQGWYHVPSGRISRTSITIEKHIPAKVEAVDVQPINELLINIKS